MMTVGLTGGIGSGKTIVSKLFEVMGCVIYNSDDNAKQIYYNAEIKQQVVKLLGSESYINEKKINTSFISDRIFSNHLLLEKLNAIIHPAVKLDFELFITKQSKDRLVIKESALLFENDLYKDLDFTILITAPKHLKITRVQKRSNMNIIDIENRMKIQWDDNKKIPLANFVIINDDKTALIPQILEVLLEIKSQIQHTSF